MSEDTFITKHKMAVPKLTVHKDYEELVFLVIPAERKLEDVDTIVNILSMAGKVVLASDSVEDTAKLVEEETSTRVVDSAYFSSLIIVPLASSTEYETALASRICNDLDLTREYLFLDKHQYDIIKYFVDNTDKIAISNIIMPLWIADLCDYLFVNLLTSRPNKVEREHKAFALNNFQYATVYCCDHEDPFEDIAQNAGLRHFLIEYVDPFVPSDFEREWVDYYKQVISKRRDPIRFRGLAENPMGGFGLDTTIQSATMTDCGDYIFYTNEGEPAVFLLCTEGLTNEAVDSAMNLFSNFGHVVALSNESSFMHFMCAVYNDSLLTPDKAKPRLNKSVVVVLFAKKGESCDYLTFKHTPYSAAVMQHATTSIVVYNNDSGHITSVQGAAVRKDPLIVRELNLNSPFSLSTFRTPRVCSYPGVVEAVHDCMRHAFDEEEHIEFLVENIIPSPWMRGAYSKKIEELHSALYSTPAPGISTEPTHNASEKPGMAITSDVNNSSLVFLLIASNRASRDNAANALKLLSLFGKVVVAGADTDATDNNLEQAGIRLNGSIDSRLITVIIPPDNHAEHMVNAGLAAMSILASANFLGKGAYTTLERYADNSAADIMMRWNPDAEDYVITPLDVFDLQKITHVSPQIREDWAYRYASISHREEDGTGFYEYLDEKSELSDKLGSPIISYKNAYLNTRKEIRASNAVEDDRGKDIAVFAQNAYPDLYSEERSRISFSDKEGEDLIFVLIKDRGFTQHPEGIKAAVTLLHQYGHVITYNSASFGYNTAPLQQLLSACTLGSSDVEDGEYIGEFETGSRLFKIASRFIPVRIITDNDATFHVSDNNFLAPTLILKYDPNQLNVEKDAEGGATAASGWKSVSIRPGALSPPSVTTYNTLFHSVRNIARIINDNDALYSNMHLTEAHRDRSSDSFKNMTAALNAVRNAIPVNNTFQPRPAQAGGLDFSKPPSKSTFDWSADPAAKEIQLMTEFYAAVGERRSSLLVARSIGLV